MAMYLNSSTLVAPPLSHKVELTGPPKVIVIAVDGQDHSKTAFQWAFANLVRPTVDKVFLVNVTSANCGYFEGGFGTGPEDAYQKKLLRSFCEMVDPRWTKMAVVAERGWMEKIVATVVNNEMADFVVIGRNDHKAPRLYVGSMSTYLKNHCKRAQVIRVRSLDDPLVIEEIDKSQRKSFLGLLG